MPTYRRPTADEETLALFGGINVRDFLRSILSPARTAERDVIGRAETLAAETNAGWREQISAQNGPGKPRVAAMPLRARSATQASLRSPEVIADFWEANAPAHWVERREGSPRIFLGRARPPRRPGSNVSGAMYRVFDMPTSIELAAALANDPSGVERAEALAEECLSRLSAWLDPDVIPTRVAWCLADPWAYEAGAGADSDDQIEDVLALCQRSLMASESTWRRWERLLRASRLNAEISAEDARASSTGGREGVNRGRRRALDEAAMSLRAWGQYRLTVALLQRRPMGDPARPPPGGEGEMIARLPDVLDPLLMIWGLGYAPAWIGPTHFVLGAPWTRPLLSSNDSWPAFWATDRSRGEAWSPLVDWPTITGSRSLDQPLPTVTGRAR